MALIDKASLLMVPSTYEAGTLYNVLPSGNRAPDSTDQNSGYDQTRADFTFDRGSNAAATRVNSDGLIEKYRENLLTYSNDFSNAVWTKADTSVTSGQADKDGGTDAWLLSITGASGFQTLRQTKSVSGVNTISIYAKANALNWMRITNGISSTYFDIANGVVGTDSSIGASIESAGNGFFRCSIPFNGAGSYVYIYPATGNGNVSQSTGSIYIQNAQLESGMVSTDYLDSGATTAKAGVLIDLPRINYDANGENGALLLEPSRQTIVKTSEYLSDSSWSNVSCTITTNNTTSPEGLKNATLLSATGSTSNRIQDYFGPLTGVHTHSVYMKSTGTATRLNLQTNDSGGLTLDVPASGTPTIQAQGSSNISGSVFIDAVGTDGWYRVGFSYTPTGGAVNNYFQIYPDSQNGTGSIYLYGIQAEAGSYPTSYIPNHGTSGGVTRAADDCEIDGDSSLFGQTEGTLFYEFSVSDYDSSENAWISIDDGSSSNRILIYSLDNEQGIRAQAKNNGTIFLQSNLKTLTSGDKVKAALAYKGDDSVFYVNGSSITLSTWLGGVSFSNPVDRITLNYGGYSSYKNYQTLVFKTRLSNEELATLTTL